MGLYTVGGARITKAGFPATPVQDRMMTVTERIYATRRYAEGDRKPEGAIRTIAFQPGAQIRESDIAKLFPPPTITSVLPSGGPAAGGTVVTITGTNLDGTSAVTFGGTAGTGLTIVSDTVVKVTVPAKAAGAVDIVLTDDAGTVTKTSGFTYS
ncbi:IPT/TIG domain-containing protein [Streptomyces sp. MJM8645]|uniref:IPT/TIG domain-containing protein n=1 Tax=Streptomycetaceae TaxID=2062 RepID=UPI0007AF4328|nr:IPT/TIG domain-containing protein [Streptomyces sp. MJM8645]